MDPTPFRTPTTPRLKRRSVPYPPFSPPPPFSPTASSLSSPIKPTSSLARRRRSSVLLAGAALQRETGTASDPEGMEGSFGSVGSGGEEVDVDVVAERVVRNGGFDMEMDGGHGGEGQGGEGGEAEAGGDKIAQAMTLLSLHPKAPMHPPPPINHTPPQPSLSNPSTPHPTSSPPQPQHWPDAEELLKESLRQSLSALRALQATKRRGVTVAESMSAFDAAQREMRGAREVLAWADSRIESEREEVGGRLLGGVGMI
ncbi:hypothetical protein EDC01DRAFT_509268 [Geopyxis carbonaria]|nr:hypothetical protein EDC01DRAFT_509268 [Geopyxis carbonaria]